jgi:hypothetical protein
MGASAWSYRVAFRTDLENTYRASQEAVITDGDFVWDYDKAGEDNPDEALVLRPESLAELAEAKRVLGEEFWEAGTHSILDTDRIVTDVDEGVDLGVVRVLSEAEVSDHFGTDRPSPVDFDRVFGSAGPLPSAGDGPAKWNGECVILFDGDQPVEVAFWGWSGD